jgi:hypothetical protein
MLAYLPALSKEMFCVHILGLRHPEGRALARRLEGSATGALRPSFEARREERRAPQDDGGVLFQKAM